MAFVKFNEYFFLIDHMSNPGNLKVFSLFLISFLLYVYKVLKVKRGTLNQQIKSLTKKEINKYFHLTRLLPIRL